ncbi:acyl-CoA dehydrogenase family protein [Leptolyngbya sp. BC1307]|uniref:acyl-CoA dehydrogenase family protein n=1 Tax=Leptolyngbya sp. BC1307 TaxID=2029589 RepID=UPI000EFA4CD7|nr:acyl-CoA dehydrogenase family protein [Leptolyngbya sp. BC1307]
MVHPVTAAYPTLKDYLAEKVVPIAHQLDQESALLFETFWALGRQGLLIPKIPTALGGLGLDTQAFWQFQSAVARHSGALAFLQTQHQSAASLLLSSENEALRQAYLPAMATGKRRVGVGFSQLRRQPAPLTAQPVPGGYQLRGEVPWVTGAGLFEEFIGAAVLESGEAVFGLLPLVSSADDRGQMTVHEPMAIAAMASTNTVKIRIEDWFLADDQMVAHRPAGWIAQRDRHYPLSPLGLIFGCTQAGIDVLVRSLSRRQIDHDITCQLTAQLDQLKTAAAAALTLGEAAYSQKIALRGQAIALMNRCAQAAVIATSGAANALGHPAQRVYGESLVFSVSGQTTGGAIASLDCLLS